MDMIIGNDIDSIFQLGVGMIKAHGVRCLSRNGAVLEVPYPVVTVHQTPRARVLFEPARDANPFFHLLESVWMLDGCEDVKFPKWLVERMSTYSDNGSNFHGAYGYRWRSHFGFDQLTAIVNRLRKDPTDRRSVLSIWSAPDDLDRISKDIPCNTQVYFKIREDKLDMTVCCRSNDMLWGAYGSNVVHFSILQEVMASLIGIEIGTMYQLSDSMHVYEDVWNPFLKKYEEKDRIQGSYPPPYNIVEDRASFWNEIERVMQIMRGAIWSGEYKDTYRYKNPWISRVVVPVFRSYLSYKQKNLSLAVTHAGSIEADDWRYACVNWLLRRAH